MHTTCQCTYINLITQQDLVKAIGPRKWNFISTHFKGRNAKQCHQR
jgi:hypothetical protein